MSDQDQSNSETPSQSSQFVGGLVMGLVLGTAGYYFFGTPEGKKQRQVLLNKWDKFRAEVAQTEAHAKTDWSQKLQGGLLKVAAEFGLGKWSPKSDQIGQIRPAHQTKKALVVTKPKPKSGVARAKFHGT
jgi:hypothetical protein